MSYWTQFRIQSHEDLPQPQPLPCRNTWSTHKHTQTHEDQDYQTVKSGWSVMASMASEVTWSHSSCKSAEYDISSLYSWNTRRLFWQEKRGPCSWLKVFQVEPKLFCGQNSDLRLHQGAHYSFNVCLFLLLFWSPHYVVENVQFMGHFVLKLLCFFKCFGITSVLVPRELSW